MMTLQRFVDVHLTPFCKEQSGYVFRVAERAGMKADTSRVVLGIEITEPKEPEFIVAPYHPRRFHGALVAVAPKMQSKQAEFFGEDAAMDWVQSKIWYSGIYWRGSGQTMLFGGTPMLWQEAATRTFNELRVKHAALALGAEVR